MSSTSTSCKHRSLMWRIRTATSREDGGFSLAEVLVAMSVLTVILGIMTSIIVTANKVSRRTTDGVSTQAQLLDAVNRVSRDVSSADPVVKADKHDVTVQVVRGEPSRCVRSRYFLHAGVLTNQVTTFNSVTCPDPTDPVGTNTTAPLPTGADVKNTKVATKVSNTAAAGIFRYYDANNREVRPGTSTPVSNADLARIARVGVRVDAPVRDRPKGVKLVTSAAIRKGVTPDTVTINGNVTAPTLRGTLQANTGRLSWDPISGVTGWVLVRDDEVIARINEPGTLTYDDRNLIPGVTYTYHLFAVNPAGTSPKSNTVVLAPRVGELPVGNGETPATKVTRTSPDETHCQTRRAPADSGPGPGAPNYNHCQGSTTTPTLKDIPNTGGLTADYGVTTIPPAPIYGWVNYTVPVYGWVNHVRDVYGWVAYQVPIYGWIQVTTPIYGWTTVSQPVYGWYSTSQPVYGWVPIVQRVPVYGWIPRYETVGVYQWNRINKVAINVYNGQKCYGLGDGQRGNVLPYPDCPPQDRDVSDNRGWMLPWEEQSDGSRGTPFLTYMGNDASGPRCQVSGCMTWFSQGQCDGYIYLIIDPNSHIQHLGHFRKVNLAQRWEDARWHGPSGHGWYMGCVYYPTYQYQQVGTTTRLTGHDWGIVGYQNAITGYSWAVTHYQTVWNWGITGYRNVNVWGITGYTTTSYWGVVSWKTQWRWEVIGRETYQLYEQIGTRVEPRWERVNWTAPTYDRTYTLRWAGTGPCPGVDLPASRTIRTSGYSDPVPTAVNVHYNSGPETAYVTATGTASNPVITRSVPRVCAMNQEP